MLGADDEQKRLWLPYMASGEKLGGFALTEPEAGSDARALTSMAERTDAGWLLNGSKVWCTNGGIASYLTVFANTVGEDGKKRTSAFLVPSPSEGLVIGKEEDKMGLKASSTVSFAMSDVAVPGNHLLGRQGKGFHLALGVLDTGRLGIGAVALGQARRMLDEACGHALDRRQFGAPIATFEMIRDKFATMASHVYAMESVIGLTAGMADRGDKDFALESAAVKVYCTEAAWWSINEALQIAGGMGFMREAPYERFLRDARVNMIFEGTNEIMRSFLALSGCRAAAELLGGGHSPTGAGLGAMPEALGPHGDAFDRDVGRFSKAVGGVLESHGHDLVDREYLQARLADALMALWVRAACLARTATLIEARGQQDAEAETLLCRHACAIQEGRMEAALLALETNQDERSTRVSELIYGARGYPMGTA
jgi:acyl-CoA dehydrogenase family protein 9